MHWNFEKQSHTSSMVKREVKNFVFNFWNVYIRINKLKMISYE